MRSRAVEAASEPSLLSQARAPKTRAFAYWGGDRSAAQRSDKKKGLVSFMVQLLLMCLL